MSPSLTGFAFAFTSGIFSIFSPCGYALLPGYVSYYLGSRFSVGRALFGGLVCSMGLITVLTVVGGLASSLGALLPQLIPILDLLAGGILIIMGVGTLSQMSLPYISIPGKLPQRKGLVGFYVFGVVYGLAGVGCSAPIFISVLFYAMSRGFTNGVLTFITYAIGMSVPLVVTSVLVAEAKEYLIHKISRVTPWFHKVGGVVLIMVGLYLFYFYYITYMS